MGIFLAIIVAVTDALKDVNLKRGTRTFSPLVLAWAWQFFSLVIFVPLIFWAGIPPLDSTFFISSSIKIVGYQIAMWFYAKSLSESEVSLAVPMLAFVPLVVSGVSYILNDELPSSLGFAGISLIIVGVYWLHSSKAKVTHWLSPFKSMLDHKGSRYMLVVAVLYGINGSLDKTAVLHSEPVFYAAYTSIVMAICLSLVLVTRPGFSFGELKQSGRWKSLAPLGLAEGVMGLLNMIAISLTVTAYVVAIKRTSILLVTLAAYWLWKEPIGNRIGPILLMLSGIGLIVLS